MDEVAQKYIADPNLVWGLSIAVLVLVIAIGWLTRYILFKVIPVLQNVATSNITLSNSLTSLSANLKENSRATEGLTQEQKLLNLQLQNVINKKN